MKTEVKTKDKKFKSWKEMTKEEKRFMILMGVAGMGSIVLAVLGIKWLKGLASKEPSHEEIKLIAKDFYESIAATYQKTTSVFTYRPSAPDNERFALQLWYESISDPTKKIFMGESSCSSLDKMRDYGQWIIDSCNDLEKKYEDIWRKKS